MLTAYSILHTNFWGVMTKVYLVRHGQTEWNKKLTFRGRIDIPLNEIVSFKRFGMRFS